jgi:hypothetical protein
MALGFKIGETNPIFITVRMTQMTRRDPFLKKRGFGSAAHPFTPREVTEEMHGGELNRWVMHRTRTHRDQCAIFHSRSSIIGPHLRVGAQPRLLPFFSHAASAR